MRIIRTQWQVYLHVCNVKQSIVKNTRLLGDYDDCFRRLSTTESA